MAYNRELGEKIRLVREKREMSREELAERTGIDKELISKIEQGDLVPYLSPLMKISRAMGVRLGTFMDDQENLGPVVTKKSTFEQVERINGSDPQANRGRTFYSMALNKVSRHMEPFIVDIAPSADSRKSLSSHEGEEFVYVLEGSIEVIYGKDRYVLTEGESIYYDSIVEHDIRSADGKSARILAVLHEPA